MIALLGDAELDEGNIFEAILEGWKQGLRNCWWIVDYNRQSLDAVVREGLWERYENLFRNFGWDVVVLKYGSLQQAAFAEPGGEVLRQWIDRCPNQLYSALVFQGGAAWRKRLRDEIGDQGAVTRTDRTAQRRRIGAADEQSRRPRPRRDHRRVRRHRSRPPGLFHRLHDQGFRPAARRPQGQSCRPDDAVADGDISRRDEYPARPGMVAVRGFERAGGGYSSVPRPACRSHAAANAVSTRRGSRCRTNWRSRCQPQMSTQTGLRRAAQRTRARHDAARVADRYDVARRDGFDKSRPVGQPARPVRARSARRHVQERTHSFDLQLGILAEGPAYRARHRRDESVHRAFGVRPVARHQRRAAAADRYPVRSLHRTRARCAELCLLSGRPFYPGGDAVGDYAGARRRRPPIDRRTLDRHGAGRAGRIRAGLRRRTRRHPRLCARLHPA